MAGVFITFEGGEGTGKSTQLALVAERLRALGLPVTTLREPGGTLVGDRVRDLLLDPAHSALTAPAELLLYEASRAQLTAERIAPALEAGEVVLCDRFTDSTVAYQGFGRGLDLDSVRALNFFATEGLTPDLTVLLDVDPETGIERATGEGADRLEAEDLAFHTRVRQGFLAIVKADERGRFAVVDASPASDEVAKAVWAVVERFLRASGVLD